MEENKNKQVASDEIDIREFLASIGKGIANFFSAILKGALVVVIYSRIFLLQNIKFFVIGAVIGAGLGFTYSYVTRSSTFETSATVRSSYLNGLYFIREVEKLDNYCKDQNYELLASVLNIPFEEASLLKGFEAQTAFGYFNLYDVSNPEKADSLKLLDGVSASQFVLTANVGLTDETPTANTALLQHGIDYYFNQLQFIDRRFLADSVLMKNKKHKLDLELAKLDSLKGIIKDKLIQQDIPNSASLEISLREQQQDIISNPLTIYAQDLSIFESKQNLERSMELQTRFEFVNDFNGVVFNSGSYIQGTATKGALLGIGITFFIMLLLLVNSQLQKIESKYVPAS